MFKVAIKFVNYYDMDLVDFFKASKGQQNKFPIDVFSPDQMQCGSHVPFFVE